MMMGNNRTVTCLTLFRRHQLGAAALLLRCCCVAFLGFRVVYMSCVLCVPLSSIYPCAVGVYKSRCRTQRIRTSDEEEEE